MQAPLVAKPRSTRRNALVVVAVVAVAGFKKFKAVLRDAAHKGGSTNWWKPDLAKAKLTSFPMIHLRGTVF